MISYEPLWKTMKMKKISTYSLIKDFGISKGTLDALKHNRSVTINTIEKLCVILNVPIESIVKIDIK